MSRTIAVTYGQRLEISNQSNLLFAPLIDEFSTPAVMVAPPKGNGEAIKIYPQRAGHFIMTDRLEGFVHEGNLTQTIYLLRKSLAADPAVSIENVPRRGYRLRVDGRGATVDARQNRRAPAFAIGASVLAALVCAGLWFDARPATTRAVPAGAR